LDPGNRTPGTREHVTVVDRGEAEHGRKRRRERMKGYSGSITQGGFICGGLVAETAGIDSRANGSSFSAARVAPESSNIVDTTARAREVSFFMTPLP